MASGGCQPLCLLIVLSVFLPDGYQQIVLTQTAGVTCNMSSRYDDQDRGCRGALNGNTNTVYSKQNCVFTKRQRNEYWLVNLGQPRNIHRIIIYPETGDDYMQGTRVLVDEVEIDRLPNNGKILTTQFITNNLPVQGQIIKLTRPEVYTGLCELQVEGCSVNTYGATCTELCNSQCRTNEGDTTCDSIDGTCIRGCKPGFVGPKCDEQCPVRCNVVCETGGCPQCEGNFAEPDCTQCRAGWYGSECDKPCSEHCKPDTDGNRRCGQTDGVCNSGCVDGQYGPHCNVSCPPNCDGGCGREDGVCNNCTTGRYGLHCNVSCPVNCDGGCQQADGVCNGCRNGYFGPRCQSPCGTGCIDNCNREDGACTCSTGWSSPICAECVSGYYGEGSCTECSSRCLDDDVCNNDNGHCPRGCDSGFDGDRCDRCNGTRWGSDCSLSCGQCAGDGSCYMNTGHCVSGCLQGFRGDNCTLAAAPGGTDTQDGGNFTGPLVGGLLGAGALIGLSVLLGAFIIRRRRSRDTSNTADTDGERVSSGDAPVRDVTERDKPETDTPGNESNYAQLEKYEDPDDIRPYSVLQDAGKLPSYLNIHSDKERTLYQNTALSTASKN